MLKTLQDLRSEILQCRKCSARSECRQPIPPDGPEKSDLLFIGRNGSVPEDKAGKPFVGAGYGPLLTEFIERVGYHRYEVMIHNVLACHTKNNRKPTDDELMICRPFCIELIKIVKPKIVVLMGNQCVNSMLQLDHIGMSTVKEHGRFYPLPEDQMTFIVHHPGFVIRQQKTFKPEFLADALRLKDYLAGEIPPHLKPPKLI